MRCLLEPPSAADLDGAAGVFIGGGSTPGYQEALAGWRGAGRPALRRLLRRGRGGRRRGRSSAGGAWATREVCAEEAGEDLDQLAVRDGLGLVPFAVDVHATQWGTLTRLVHAVGAGLVDEGWALDEGTVLVVEDGSIRVDGLGSAYRVAPRDGAVAVSVQP